MRANIKEIYMSGQKNYINLINELMSISIIDMYRRVI